MWSDSERQRFPAPNETSRVHPPAHAARPDEKDAALPGNGSITESSRTPADPPDGVSLIEHVDRPLRPIYAQEEEPAEILE